MKSIIISGASKGIGKEVVLKFLEKGDRVFGIARTEEELRGIQERYGKDKFQYIAGDLSQDSFLQNLAAAYPWQQVDILYNNAGYIVVKDFEKLSIKDFNDSLHVNFIAAAMLIQEMLPKMSSNSHIVNIGTMGAVQGSVKFSGLAAYSSSKAALANLTELLAEEWKDGKGPKINYLALGAVQTEMLEKAFPGYQAPLKAEEMATYLVDFGLNASMFYNGKILPVSLSTP